MAESPTAQNQAFDAALSRGWEQLEQGDIEGAERSAREAIAVDERSPEGHTLWGAVASASGDVEGALAHYAEAIERDPDFLDPLLYSAELHAWSLEEYAEAIELCDRALEIAEEEDEFLDALLLKAESQLADEDEDGARQTLAELPPATYPDAVFHLRAGLLRLELNELDAAVAELDKALALQPDLTDALHALALVHEARGDAQKMVAAFLKVREADLAAPAPPWGVPRRRFEELAETALAELPERMRQLLANVPIVATDYPALELVTEGNDPRMMGFFSGVPWPEKTTSGDTPHLDCVFLYQRNIERFCQSVPEVEQEIRKTLLHETGHFFGLSEEELDEMGLG